MIILLHPDSEAWAQRTALRIKVAKDAGIDCVGVPLPERNNADRIETLIEDHGAKALVDHCLILGPHMVDYLAPRFPGVAFTMVCHSSLAHLCIANRGPALLRDALDVVQRHKNAFFGSPDERNELGKVRNLERVVWVPNPVGIKLAPREQAPREIPTICLAGRADPVKNYAHQIAAAALLKPCTVVAAVRDSHRMPLQTMGEAFDVPVRLVDFMPRKEWLSFLRDRVDLVLQCSHTESFNYVGVEALCMGVAVVGSTAIRYLPQEWRANPDSIEDIAGIAQMLLADPVSSRTHAIEVGHKYAQEMDGAFVEWLRQWG